MLNCALAPALQIRRLKARRGWTIPTKGDFVGHFGRRRDEDIENRRSVGALNPSDRRTANAIAEIGNNIKAMPLHPIFAPGVETLGRAALLSGILCRLQ